MYASIPILSTVNRHRDIFESTTFCFQIGSRPHASNEFGRESGYSLTCCPEWKEINGNESNTCGQGYKWVALVNFLREKKEKTRRREKRQEKKPFARPCVELSPFMLSKIFNLFCLYWCMYFVMKNSRRFRYYLRSAPKTLARNLLLCEYSTVNKARCRISHVNLRRTSTFRTNYCSLLSFEMLREPHIYILLWWYFRNLLG